MNSHLHTESLSPQNSKRLCTLYTLGMFLSRLVQKFIQSLLNLVSPFISARFMQGQPNLHALGGSWIELFKTFCLPTMLNQTTNDFLWIILMDPNLDNVFLKEMKKLVAPYPHFFLVKRVAQEIDLMTWTFRWW